MEEITPEESVVPIYLMPPTEEEILELEQWALEEEARLQQEQERIVALEAARNSAIEKLSLLGLTEEEARAVIGIG